MILDLHTSSRPRLRSPADVLLRRFTLISMVIIQHPIHTKDLGYLVQLASRDLNLEIFGVCYEDQLETFYFKKMLVLVAQLIFEVLESLLQELLVMKTAGLCGSRC